MQKDIKSQCEGLIHLAGPTIGILSRLIPHKDRVIVFDTVKSDPAGHLVIDYLATIAAAGIAIYPLDDEKKKRIIPHVSNALEELTHRKIEKLAAPDRLKNFLDFMHKSDSFFKEEMKRLSPEEGRGMGIGIWLLMIIKNSNEWRDFSREEINAFWSLGRLIFSKFRSYFDQ